MIGGYTIVTTQVLYWLPDYRHLLQEFVFQKLDLFPELPEIRKFIRYWRNNIEAEIRGVMVTPSGLLAPRFIPVTEIN